MRSTYTESTTFSYMQLTPDQVFCHDSATDPYAAWLKVHKRIFTLEKNASLFSLQLSPIKLIPVHAGNPSGTEYQFFQSFYTRYNHQIWDGKTQIPVLILSNPISENEIRIQAWGELIRLIFNRQLCPDTGLPSVRQTINNMMPEQLIRHFFGSKTLSVNELCRITEVTRRVYDFQHQKLQETQTTKAKTKFTAQSILKGAQ